MQAQGRREATVKQQYHIRMCSKPKPKKAVGHCVRATILRSQVLMPWPALQLYKHNKELQISKRYSRSNATKRNKNQNTTNHRSSRICTVWSTKGKRQRLEERSHELLGFGIRWRGGRHEPWRPARHAEGRRAPWRTAPVCAGRRQRFSRCRVRRWGTVVGEAGDEEREDVVLMSVRAPLGGAVRISPERIRH
jgi:hypothetical protein